jgi:hypothetical protein
MRFTWSEEVNFEEEEERAEAEDGRATTTHSALPRGVYAPMTDPAPDRIEEPAPTGR